jgi:hypothetical protein
LLADPLQAFGPFWGIECGRDPLVRFAKQSGQVELGQQGQMAIGINVGQPAQEVTADVAK